MLSGLHGGLKSEYIFSNCRYENKFNYIREVGKIIGLTDVEDLDEKFNSIPYNQSGGTMPYTAKAKTVRDKIDLVLSFIVSVVNDKVFVRLTRLEVDSLELIRPTSKEFKLDSGVVELLDVTGLDWYTLNYLFRNPVELGRGVERQYDFSVKVSEEVFALLFLKLPRIKSPVGTYINKCMVEKGLMSALVKLECGSKNMYLDVAYVDGIMVCKKYHINKQEVF